MYTMLQLGGSWVVRSGVISPRIWVNVGTMGLY